MKHALLSLVLAAAMLTSLAACVHAPCPVSGGADFHAGPATPPFPWTHLNFHNDPDNFQFAIVADRTGGPRKGVFESAVAKLNLLQPEFVMCVGDLIPGYTKDPGGIDAQWDEFLGLLKPLEMPFFFLAGNHDLSYPPAKEVWKRRFGPSYYHFLYKNALFLCINTEDAGPSKLSDEQAAYFVRVLEANADVRWTFVFMHKPMWTEAAPNGWEPIEAALKDRPCTIFAGHAHEYRQYTRQGHEYLILSTTGGDSALGGVLQGQFDHIMWVTMGAQKPSIACLMLDGIQASNVRTAEMAGVVNALQRTNVIATDPLYAASSASAGTPISTRLCFRNDADAPMRLTAKFLPNETLRPDPAEFNFEIPRKSQEVRPLNVSILKSQWTSPLDLAPLLLEWSISCEKPGLPPFSIAGKQALGVEIPLPCARRTAPVSIDGKLDEWADLPVACEKPAQIRIDPKSWTGPADGSFRFATAYDDQFLYLAVDVTDDQFCRKDDPYPWNQDGIEVRLNAEGDPARSRNTGSGEFAEILPVLMSPSDASHPVLRYNPDQLPEGTRAECVRTDKGFAAEIAIPISWLDAQQEKPWEAFRLNIAVDDFDGPADTGAQLNWRPDWRTPESYPGSGTFLKAK